MANLENFNGVSSPDYIRVMDQIYGSTGLNHIMSKKLLKAPPEKKLQGAEFR